MATGTPKWAPQRPRHRAQFCGYVINGQLSDIKINLMTENQSEPGRWDAYTAVRTWMRKRTMMKMPFTALLAGPCGSREIDAQLAAKRHEKSRKPASQPPPFSSVFHRAGSTGRFVYTDCSWTCE